MRALGKAFIVFAAGLFSFTILIPAALVAGLALILVQIAAAVFFIGMVLSFIGWLITHNPAALNATAICAVYGSIAFLPVFSLAWWRATVRERQARARLDASFVEPRNLRLDINGR